MVFDENIDQRLLRYLSGESGEDERKQVETWLKADENHYAYYQEMQMLHLKMRWMERGKEVRAGFLDFNRKWQRKKRRRLFYQCAASAVVLLGIGVALWMRGGGVEEETEGIQPGRPQAILYMASGQVVSMDKDARELREADGTSINIDPVSGMTYNVSTGEEIPEILYNRVVVPKGGEFRLTLSDGTRVWLNSFSELHYPVNFTGKKREVVLKGEAYFDVVGDAEHPFVVNVNDLEISVLGTQFNVNAHAEGIVKTVLVEGAVNLRGKNGEMELHPRQMGVYREADGELRLAEVDVVPHVAWKDGNFIFRSESLENIMDKLSIWYNLDVSYTKDDLRHITLSGNLFRYENVDQLFNLFERISDARFQVVGRRVVIGGEYSEK